MVKVISDQILWYFAPVNDSGQPVFYGGYNDKNEVVCEGKRITSLNAVANPNILKALDCSRGSAITRIGVSHKNTIDDVWCLGLEKSIPIIRNFGCKVAKRVSHLYGEFITNEPIDIIKRWLSTQDPDAQMMTYWVTHYLALEIKRLSPNFRSLKYGPAYWAALATAQSALYSGNEYITNPIVNEAASCAATLAGWATAGYDNFYEYPDLPMRDIKKAQSALLLDMIKVEEDV